MTATIFGWIMFCLVGLPLAIIMAIFALMVVGTVVLGLWGMVFSLLTGRDCL